MCTGRSDSIYDVKRSRDPSALTVPQSPEVIVPPEVTPSPPEVNPELVPSPPEVAARPEVKKWYASIALLHNGITGLYICVACCRLRLVVMLWGEFNQHMRIR